MQFLSDDDVIAVYREVVGDPVLRYAAGLSSAVGRPQQSAFGEDAYPTLVLKAAVLMQSLAQNQPFVDGNKRIAWVCGKLFLQINGLTVEATDSEALDLFSNRIAAGAEIKEIGAWIEQRSAAFRRMPSPAPDERT